MTRLLCLLLICLLPTVVVAEWREWSTETTGAGGRVSGTDWNSASSLNRQWETIAISASAATLTGDGKYVLTSCAGGNLDTLNGTTTGDVVIIRYDGVGGNCTVRDGIGNIELATNANIVLSSINDHIMLINTAGTLIQSSTLTGSTGGTGSTDFTTNRVNVALSAGIITVAGSGKYTVTGCGGNNLDTINGTSDGDLFIITYDGTGGNCTIRDNIGNIQLPDNIDIALTTSEDAVLFEDKGANIVMSRILSGFASRVPSGTVAARDADITSPTVNHVWRVTDGSSASDCDTGGGTDEVLCCYSAVDVQWESCASGVGSGDTLNTIVSNGRTASGINSLANAVRFIGDDNGFCAIYRSASGCTFGGFTSGEVAEPAVDPVGVNTAATVQLVGSDCARGHFYNNDADAIEYEAPIGAAIGCKLCFFDAAGGAISFDPEAGDTILGSTQTVDALNAGDKVTLAAGEDNFFCVAKITSNTWRMWKGLGALSDGGP